MCTAIYVDNKLCETLGELTEALGGEPVLEQGEEQDPEFCLCSVDIDATAKKYAYSWKQDDWCDIEFTKRLDGDFGAP